MCVCCCRCRVGPIDGLPKPASNNRQHAVPPLRDALVGSAVAILRYLPGMYGDTRPEVAKYSRLPLYRFRRKYKDRLNFILVIKRSLYLRLSVVRSKGSAQSRGVPGLMAAGNVT